MNKILLATIAAMGIAMGIMFVMLKAERAANDDLTSKNAHLETINAQLLSNNNRQQEIIQGLQIEAESKDKILADNRTELEKHRGHNANLKRKLKELADVKPIVKNYFYERVPDDVLRLLKPAGNRIPDGHRNSVPTRSIDDSDTRADDDRQYERGINQLLFGFAISTEAVQLRQEVHAGLC